MSIEDAACESFEADIWHATTLFQKYQIAHDYYPKYKELVSKGLIPGQKKASYVGLCKLAKIPSDSYYYTRKIIEKEYDQQEYKDKLQDLKNELLKGDRKGVGEKDQIKYAFNKMRKWDNAIKLIERIPESIKYLKSIGKSNDYIADTIERATGSRREAIEIMKDRGLDLPPIVEHDATEPAPETMPEMLQYQNHPSWDLHEEMEQQMYEKVSDNMHDLLQELWQHVYKAKDILDKIYEQGLRDGLTNQEIRTLITEALSFKGLQERQIRSLLPSELKRTYNISSKTDITSVNSAMTAESVVKGEEPITIEQPISVSRIEEKEQIVQEPIAAVIEVHEPEQPPSERFLHAINNLEYDFGVYNIPQTYESIKNVIDVGKEEGLSNEYIAKRIYDEGYRVSIEGKKGDRKAKKKAESATWWDYPSTLLPLETGGEYFEKEYELRFTYHEITHIHGLIENQVIGLPASAGSFASILYKFRVLLKKLQTEREDHEKKPQLKIKIPKGAQN
jgi:hypothetical protein